ncbi:MAG: hypothetical protein HUK20_08030 [Fibrobacter sp.]|nr:hypothetical protein [Fibrobacter sp.]
MNLVGNLQIMRWSVALYAFLNRVRAKIGGGKTQASQQNRFPTFFSELNSRQHNEQGNNRNPKPFA